MIVNSCPIASPLPTNMSAVAPMMEAMIVKISLSLNRYDERIIVINEINHLVFSVFDKFLTDSMKFIYPPTKKASGMYLLRPNDTYSNA